MGYHHIALATRDMPATDVFYTRAMGFRLVKVEVASTPSGGFAKHFFYDTGGGEMLAFWELHDDTIPDDFPTALSSGVGLPPWVNHIAFAGRDRADLGARRNRLLEHGYDVAEIDHGWCESIYATDPNGTLVEFCITTADFGAADGEAARRALADPTPTVSEPPPVKLHRARCAPLHTRAASD
ncbi:MAG: VOC family protein [Deltaproteobacteria bacterium]|nr:MAG: VOC family protein [Deltaproteobacteria bacterium]